MKTLKYILLTLIIVLTLLYILFLLFSTRRYDISYGISFNQNHATDLGLDWKVVYLDMLTDLQPKYIRIAAMWSEVEKDRFVYDFSNVDFMMREAAKHDAKVVLVVGQKAPRWPECHVPDWLDYGAEASREHLFDYIEKVVERYKHHEALELWQVENEAFINFKFGECENFQRDAVQDEIALVRELDPDHKIIMTDSGELSTWKEASKAGDLFGTTMYRIVKSPGGFTFSYDWLPAGFYRLKAKWRGRGYDDFFVSELQAEPWFTNASPQDTPVAEQEKTMNPKRFKKHIDYVERVGASRAYLWGVEWWYFMKQKNNDARYWDFAREVMERN